MMTSANSQIVSEEITREVSLYGGISIPYLPVDSKNYSSNGWNAGITCGEVLPQGKVGTSAVFFSAEYTRFAVDRPKVLAAFGGVIASANPTTTLNLMVNYRGTFSSVSKVFQPYFLFGVGFMHISQGEISMNAAQTFPTTSATNYTIASGINNGFSWTAGIGFAVPVNETLSLFFQGRSLLGVVNPTRQSFPINAGIRYRY